MHPTHALAPDCLRGGHHRPLVVCILFSLLLPFATAAVAFETKCSDLASSALPEPEGRVRACVPEGGVLPSVRAAPKSGTATAYALNLRQDEFVRHTLGDFPGQTFIAANDDDLLGLDFDPTATILYALNDDTNEFGTLGLTNGVFSAIGPSIPLPSHSWTGMSVDPVTGAVFASSSGLAQESALYTINPSTGAATLRFTYPNLDIIIDIAVNCLGELYVHEIVTDMIYRINPANGQVTTIGPTNVGANFPQGMDFDNQTGDLYAYVYQGTGNHQYGTVNLNTGRFTADVVNMPSNSQFEGATQTTCDGASPLIFPDDWESGDTSAW